MADTLTARYQFTKPQDQASAGTWGQKNNADMDLYDTYIAIPRIAATAPTVGATTTLDFNSATGSSVFAFTVSQATTLAFANVPAATLAGGQTAAVRAVLLVTNGSAFALTFPASVTFAAGAPYLQASGVDVIEMWSVNGGTNWYAFHVTAVAPKRHTLATNSGTQAVPGVSGTAILTWNTNDASDVGGLHSTSVNPTRIQIPSGWEAGRGILLVAYTTATALSSSPAEGVVTTIRKNGSTTQGTIVVAKGNSNAVAGTVTVYDPAPVVTDYWEVTVTCSDGGGVNELVGNTSRFSGVQLDG